MSIFSKIFRRQQRETTTGSAGSVQVSVPGADFAFGSSVPMSVATVYRCVNLLADSVSNLPMRYMRLRDDVFVPSESGRLNYLLSVQPCPWMSAVDFWKQVVRYMLLEGNAYIIPQWDVARMDWAGLYLPDSRCVAHDIIANTYTVNDPYSGVYGTWTEDEVIHIMNYSKDGMQGISTIAYARMAIDVAGAGDRETLNRFRNGGNVRGILSNDTLVRGFGEYQDAQLDGAAKDIDKKFSSGRKIVSLPGQVQFSPISLSSTDMQFLETRKFSVSEICRFFGVHPSFVFADTSNNYKSVEMANVAFLTSTLNPILRKIENEFLRKLVPESLALKRKFEFDRRAIYTCDLESKIDYQTKTIAAGIYTVNDWRRAENLQPVEGGDIPLVSANLKTLKEYADGAAEEADPAPQEEGQDGNGKQ